MNNISISSKDSWQIKSTEKRQSSFSSIDLPSEYPSSQRKSHSVTSTTFLDEFDGIDEVFDRVLCRKRLDSSTSTIDEQHLSKSDSCSSLKTSSRRRPPGHRRQRTRIDSTESYKKMVVSSNRRRRQRHNAFCAKDFHKKILTELYYPHF